MVSISARELQPRVQTALRNSPIHELRGLRVEPSDEGLLISGEVSSFYHKQLAQEAVRSLCEDTQVDLVNLIRVR